ncbi:LmeA family phospholipid-binding protein [Phycicoccus flavus]|uniref:DUF2993 domain-containing protein n=1 Tax=Phycicoccus flavus TaxID=2502783 RepID=A0A8T6QZL6_9MICO|nr:LmeA family phospholipid-binding protein [Phycicoccus flavus]NHA67408.1 hypothetical protein [Phycicoccus flavus]
MRQFLLGVVSTLVVLVLAGAALLASLGGGAGPAPALPSPAPSGVRVPPPDDLTADQTWLGAVDLRSREVVSADGDLVDVEATGTGVRFGPEALEAATLAIRATVPFDTASEQVGDGTRLYAVSGGLVGLRRPARVLGRDLVVQATGTVRAEDGRLVLEPETVDVGGPGFVGAAASALARDLVRLRLEVPGVPEGMVLREVSVSGAGFDVRLDGTDVTVQRGDLGPAATSSGGPSAS